MQSLNILQDFKPYHVDEIPITNRETYELLENIHSTNVNRSIDLSDSWSLQKAYIIQNKSFDREFNEKRDEIREQAYYPDHWDVRFGFLATTKNEIIDKLAEEGLEIKLCPCNYLGHNASGVHISMNADVCLNEARSKFSSANEITLIIFKYMLGRRKMVPMYDPKTLLAPTPNFDSHVCEERPIPSEKHTVQYIKSLVYLYEFANDLFDPVIRPRHCVPIGALIFKNLAPLEILDLTESESADTLSIYNKNRLSLNPNNQQSKSSFWNAPYSNYKNEQAMNDKQTISSNEDWRPINYEDVFSRSVGESLMLKSFDREKAPDRSGIWKDNKFERNKKWKDGISVYGGQKYNNLLSTRPGKTT